MAVPRQFADARSLRRVASAVFGTSRRLAHVRRLPGGSKKGSYRITMDDGATALVYVWNPAEDYWQGVLPDEASDPAGPFSHASGLDLFEAAAGRLATAGVRCPRLLLADRSRDLYPGDIAVVEHVPGGSLETLLEDNPAAAQRPLAVLAGWLASMESCQSALFGKVVVADAGQPSRGASCPQVILDRALRDLSEVRAVTRAPPGTATGWKTCFTRSVGRWNRARRVGSYTANWARTTSCSTATATRC